ncbi:MAG: substrate-binding domain-containing protein [Oscillospiraceae bacterium]|nr:substrate-binding domain-containing protein [Oscillospiraceae bacterium]
MTQKSKKYSRAAAAFAVFLMAAACLGAIFGCGQKYPKIKVTANGEEIPHYIIPVKWEGDVAGGVDAYAYAFEKNPDMEELFEVSSGDLITVDFAGGPPDKLAISYELLTVPYYGGENASSAVDELDAAFESDGNKYSLKVEAFEIGEYSSDTYFLHWTFTPNYYGPPNSDLRYIAGRAYKISAAWGENECEYIFLVKNREDLGKEDLSFADKNANVNVMLERPAGWQKIVDEPPISEKEIFIVDGSTATLPITAELCRQFFDYSDEKVYDLVYSGILYPSTTHFAYVNLIEQNRRTWIDPNATKDLILVTPPSDEEKKLAKEAGVELDIAPIARDGFVFITNKDNPIDSLTAEQVRAIYSGEITNWKQVGGEDMAIEAYQREPNSGSQTAMEQMVMQGKKMIAPIDTQLIGAMGELIEAVAEYKNAKASIGYTYYYYINNLYKNENIKVLQIGGVAPENENLQNGSYPYATYYYAVIRSDEADGSPARRLRDFLVGELGQRLIEMAGYCKISG